jgi:hypothetical protein
MFISKRDKIDLFDRLRIIETDLQIQKERDDNILEKLELNNSNFLKHDENEMLKYEKIEDELKLIKEENQEDRKYRNYAVAVIFLLQFLNELGYLAIK